MKRIEIEEIGVEVASRPQRSLAGQSELAQKITAKEEQAFDSRFTITPSSTSSSETHIDKQSHSKSDSDAEVPLIVDKDSKVRKPNGDLLHVEGKSSPSVETASQIATQKHHLNKIVSSETILTERKRTEAEKMESIATNHVPASDPAGGAGGDSPRFQVPQSSFQFQADFKLLKKKPEAFFQYFQAIPPSRYSNLFGQCFDADILNAVLTSLSLYRTKAEIDLFEILHNLTLVKRFTVTAMFLSKKDKQVLEDLLKHISANEQHTQEELTDLRQKYQL
ncbi:RNA polymerase ii-associated protein 3 [Plakobranchus ocellatus]|uniref:RNA polymerase ii-associated protein 3 n=1 Tax=Plakobranchus ocellatus TaxID=259542 RepID=A0AAV4CLH9_9GAST|nr:RNA polymerase ii-associated protein 3 [Plakobranchus ocellatus]